MKTLVTVFSLLSLSFFMSLQAKADSPQIEFVSQKYLPKKGNDRARIIKDAKTKKVVDLSNYEINNSELFVLKSFNKKTIQKNKKRIMMLAKAF